MADKVFIVQGVHPIVPGCPMTAHRTLEGADKEATSLVKMITEASVGPQGWSVCLDEYRRGNELDEATCDVWVTELELKS